MIEYTKDYYEYLCYILGLHHLYDEQGDPLYSMYEVLAMIMEKQEEEQ